MKRSSKSTNEAAFFNRPHAKWVVGVLSMLIAVVGEDSLLGILLRQTRFEIRGLLREEQQTVVPLQAGQYENN
ncbi:MAG TPA: hypothetical protein VN688_27330 [Gemmataceae bacterium]|nr:hypothetical protein [Gemmataceae bacterium]